MTMTMLYLCAALLVTCVVCENDNKLDVADFADLHNNARREQESLQPLTWDAELAKTAQDLVDVCVWKQMYFRSKRMVTYIGDATQSGTPSHAMDSWTDQRKFVTNGLNGACCNDITHTCCEYNKIMSDKATAVGCGHKVCDQLTIANGTLANVYDVICLYQTDSPADQRGHIKTRRNWREGEDNGCGCCPITSRTSNSYCCTRCTEYNNRFQTTTQRILYSMSNGWLVVDP